METQDKDYIERFLTHIGQDDQLNELETLRRVKNARVWKTENETDGTTVTTEVVGSCSPDQFQKVYQAANTALNWLNKAVAPGRRVHWARPTLLEILIPQPLLTCISAAKQPAVVRHIREQLAHIRADIERAPQFSIECHGTWDPGCAQAGAYAEREHGLIVFCYSFFGDDALGKRKQSFTKWPTRKSAVNSHPTDRAYQADRVLPSLSTEEALTNAESYGLLVQQLGTGKTVKSTAPQDKQEKLPEGLVGFAPKGGSSRATLEPKSSGPAGYIETERTRTSFQMGNLSRRHGSSEHRRREKGGGSVSVETADPHYF